MIRTLTLVLALAAAPLAAQTTAIVNAKLEAGTAAGPVDGATVIIQNGRIAAAGRGVTVPAGATVVDAGGKWVTPGIIAGFSRLAIVEVDAVDPSEDAEAEKSPFSAALDISPAINQRSVNIPINRIEGLTRAVVAPSAGRDIFGGQGAIVGLGGGDDTLMRARAFQFVELGERGANLAGGSRAASFLTFRNGLTEAQLYARNPVAYDSGRDREAILTRLDVAALVPVVQGRIPALIHAERASDIQRVLDLRTEFPALKIIIVGGAEGWVVASKLAAAKVPVIATATQDLPSSFEMLGATESNVGRMVAAGVTVALGMIDNDDARQVRLLPQHAGNLVAMAKIPGATGLTHAQALAAITSMPAKIFGMSDLGTLEAGKRADVVIWDGDPLELATAPTAVYIDGKPMPMTSRQTELRDRYLRLNPNGLPYQYKRN